MDGCTRLPIACMDGCTFAYSWYGWLYQTAYSWYGWLYQITYSWFGWLYQIAYSWYVWLYQTAYTVAGMDGMDGCTRLPIAGMDGMDGCTRLSTAGTVLSDITFAGTPYRPFCIYFTKTICNHKQ